MKYINIVLTSVFVLFCYTYSVAQSDSTKMVKYSLDFKFSDGIYLNFTQVKNNLPIQPSKIETAEDIKSIDFYEKVLSEETIIIFDENGMKQEIAVEEIWGYSNMGILFVQQNNEFNRVPIVGSLSHFVSMIVVKNQRGVDPFNNYYNPYYYDPMHNNNRYSSSSSELRQYIIDFETGNIIDFTRKNLKALLVHDPELYEDYNNLSRRKQRKMLFFYLRRYNERNPLFIPVYK